MFLSKLPNATQRRSLFPNNIIVIALWAASAADNHPDVVSRPPTDHVSALLFWFTHSLLAVLGVNYYMHEIFTS